MDGGLSSKLRRVMIGLGTIGLADASYLTYVHYAKLKPACTAGQACEIVQTSVWSEVAGVPVALLGLIGYVLILGSLLVRDREDARLAALAVTLMGFSFSAYLTYRELFSIHKICEWCATSAGLMTLLFIFAVTRFLLGEARVSPSITNTPEMARLTPHGQ
jgi:uncharacterized membrane protein